MSTFTGNTCFFISAVLVISSLVACVYILRKEILLSESGIIMAWFSVSLLGSLIFAAIGSYIYASLGVDTEKASRLRTMSPDLNDPASNYVLQAYVSLCQRGYDDKSLPCGVAVARNVFDSPLTVDQKTRARQYVAKHANVPVGQLP